MNINMNEIEASRNPTLALGLGAIEASLRTKIKLYKKRAYEVEKYLTKHPEQWGKFQHEFNSEVNSIFRDDTSIAFIF